MEQEFDRLRAELREVQSHRQKTPRNFAVAGILQLAERIKAIIAELCDRKSLLTKEISKLQETCTATSTTDLLGSALTLFRQLPELADDDNNLSDIGRAFRILNLQMLVRVQPIKKRIRVENKVSGGVITFGDASPPTEKYTEQTATTAVKTKKPRKEGRSKDSQSSKHESGSGSDGEANSSRNVDLHER